MSKKNLVHAAIAGLVLSAGLGSQALADEHGMKSEKEECYGVAEAGKNDCATGSSSRAGMVAVIFEVEPGEGKNNHYLDIAAEILPLVKQVEGFISVERFQSFTNPKKILSLSFFEDEDAIKRWRTLAAHRKAQSKGRSEIFDDYRIRIAHVIRDYGMFDREQAPEDSRRFHDKE